MRAAFLDQGKLFSYLSPEARVPASHPLRKIRELVRDVLGDLNRSLGRGPILARPSPSCAHDYDRLRLPPASPPCRSGGGKKESTDHRLNQVCQRCVTPSSISCFDRRLNDARTAEDGPVQESSVNESAKVVLILRAFLENIMIVRASTGGAFFITNLLAELERFGSLQPATARRAHRPPKRGPLNITQIMREQAASPRAGELGHCNSRNPVHVQRRPHQTMRAQPKLPATPRKSFVLQPPQHVQVVRSDELNAIDRARKSAPAATMGAAISADADLQLIDAEAFNDIDRKANITMSMSGKPPRLTQMQTQNELSFPGCNGCGPCWQGSLLRWPRRFPPHAVPRQWASIEERDISPKYPAR